MWGKTICHRMFVWLAVVAGCSILVQTASACDRDKLARLASGIPLTAQQLRPLASTGAQLAAGSGTQNVGAAITGLWMVTDFVEGQPYDQYFDTWHADGNEMFIDNTNPAADNVCQGIWKQVAVNRYKLKHVSWTFDETGTVNGTAIFHDIVQLSADGNSFAGSENVYLYDLNGNLVGEYDGDVLQGTRITMNF